MAPDSTDAVDQLVELAAERGDAARRTSVVSRPSGQDRHDRVPWGLALGPSTSTARRRGTLLNLHGVRAVRVVTGGWRRTFEQKPQCVGAIADE
jgi:hypothetical protein